MCGCDFLRFVSTSEVQVEELPWGPHEWMVRPGMTQGENLLLVRVTMPPGEAHQFHRHPHMEEALYYVSGKAEQWVGQQSRIVQAGEVVHVPVNEVHGTYNIFDEPVVFLAILSPAVFEGPALIDVCKEEPWCSLKTPMEYPPLPEP